jgi:hypothetical protein
MVGSLNLERCERENAKIMQVICTKLFAQNGLPQ